MTIADDDFPLSEGAFFSSIWVQNNTLRGIEEWLFDQIPPPQTCEINVALDKRGYFIFSATTMRSGSITQVEKIADPTINLFSETRRIYAYFEENCPAPSREEADQIYTGDIGRLALSLMTEEGARLYRDWITMAREYDIMPPALYLGYSEVTNEKLGRVEFQLLEGGTFLHTSLILEGNITFTENQAGVTVMINQPVSETVANSAKGNMLSALVDLPGADEMKIKTVKLMDGDNHLRLRTSTNVDPAAMPNGTPKSKEASQADLNLLLGEESFFTLADAYVIEKIRALPVEQQCSLLHNIIYYGKRPYELTLFGLPGWTFIANHTDNVAMNYAALGPARSDPIKAPMYFQIRGNTVPLVTTEAPA
ncbi:hypothetical protein [Croceicoccus gelatinilyticus]|uniref:hypothetical protein n=1 Tax=Croceicoccus gelatinilyticus TaxID=2835536 RepID=UPI001BCDF718|nr:hypothetical protein [Croceicoccus gelatinilyticus]MBS7671415.1 hypothetical protein [Croceicoccus gelatinilyticus]